MRKILMVAIALICVLSVGSVNVFGSPEEYINVNVTPTLVSVALSPAAINFGAVALNQESAASSEISATNNGSVTEDLDVKGTDAAYGTNIWTLSDSTNGADQYMMKISKDGWANVTNLSTTYVNFQDNLSTSANQNFRVKVKMPTSVTAYEEHSAKIYMLATQH